MAKGNVVDFVMKTKNWWLPLTVIVVVSLAGVGMIGYQTYYEAPPRPSFLDSQGGVVFSEEDIISGQIVFQKYALMNYGSMFGDGALRGPDFTAEALHQVHNSMVKFYRGRAFSTIEIAGIESMVQAENKRNRFEDGANTVQLTPSQVAATIELIDFYKNKFNPTSGEGSVTPHSYITDESELRNLAAFFFWGSWVCVVERPGEKYSYTHNWPFDPAAGNSPTPAVMIWTIIGSLGLIFGIGVVLFFYGRLEKLNDAVYMDKSKPFMSVEGVESFVPTHSQKSTYKFFAVAILLFAIQVIAGILTVHDFVGFTKFFGYDLRSVLPITITRSWHVQLSVLWIAACWIGASLFVVPFVNPNEPKGQVAYINTIFILLVTLVGGSLIGMFMGPHGLLPNTWYWLGNQGWEFIELGKLWQAMLMLAFVVWALALIRAIKPVMKWKKPWALPNWLLYAVISVIVLLVSGFVATPRTNFVIADFWRWCVVHMWAEAFFEVFTTVLIGYFMVLMGLVSVGAATRVIYLATLLFLGSGLLGISHNFYWNGKPVATMALGSVFSTLQVIPLILLTLEAWRFRKLPSLVEGSEHLVSGTRFGLPDVFLFLLGVNFWNFFGAGVYGFIINLPIANYYEHGTYLTVNHGHMALMGVYGNLSIAGVLFCCRLLFHPASWNSTLIRRGFWSINIGLILMSFLDLFPAGVHQLNTVLTHGLWFARSEEYIGSSTFQSFTWLRIVGGGLFFVGGVVPLSWFVVSRFRRLKESSTWSKELVVTQSLKHELETVDER